MKTPYAYRAFTVYGRTFQSVPLRWSHAVSWSYYPGDASTTPVWAVPRSLATTCGITVVFFSYGYLDVSVPRVRLLFQDGRPSTCRVAPFGYPGIKGYLHLLRAFRSLAYFLYAALSCRVDIFKLALLFLFFSVSSMSKIFSCGE